MNWLVRRLAVVEGVVIAMLAVACAILQRRLRARHRDVVALSEVALVDSLTGLRNRRAFDEELTRALRVRSRGPISPQLALVMIDMHGLKALNDSLGHQAGDERLVRLGQILQANVRGGDSVYRLGGDEFVVILPGQGAREARALLGRVGVGLAEHAIAIAAGIADAVSTVSTAALIGRADRALIAAKRGPDHIVVWQPGMAHAAHLVPVRKAQAPPADEPS